MEQYFGTVFLFKELATGETVKMKTGNGVAWSRPDVMPELDEDFEETGEMIEGDCLIPFEMLIKKYRPLEPKGITFTRWCMNRIVTGYYEKIGDINAFLSELATEG